VLSYVEERAPHLGSAACFRSATRFCRCPLGQRRTVQQSSLCATFGALSLPFRVSGCCRVSCATEVVGVVDEDEEGQGYRSLLLCFPSRTQNCKKSSRERSQIPTHANASTPMLRDGIPVDLLGLECNGHCRKLGYRITTIPVLLLPHRTCSQLSMRFGSRQIFVSIGAHSNHLFHCITPS
jgi:hypothetical protein